MPNPSTLNYSQINSFPVEEVLSQIGKQPVKTSERELWFTSPFRDENTPSFKVDVAKKIWYDFGEGIGGKTSDLIKKLYNIPENDHASLFRKVEELQKEVTHKLSHTLQQKESNLSVKLPETPIVHKILKPKHPALLEYLKGRRISQKIANLYLNEVHYSLHGNRYFALGFANIGGGYELRNPIFKGCTTKQISLLVKEQRGMVLCQPQDLPQTNYLNIFEGFFDFLSALEHQKARGFNSPTIILNSISQKEKALQIIQNVKSKRLNLFLDQDDAGRSTLHFFLKQLGNSIKIKDQSSIYRGFKDYNEFWSTA